MALTRTGDASPSAFGPGGSSRCRAGRLSEKPPEAAILGEARQERQRRAILREGCQTEQPEEPRRLFAGDPAEERLEALRLRRLTVGESAGSA